jgi:hypothetical protein
MLNLFLQINTNNVFVLVLAALFSRSAKETIPSLTTQHSWEFRFVSGYPNIYKLRMFEMSAFSCHNKAD